MEQKLAHHALLIAALAAAEAEEVADQLHCQRQHLEQTQIALEIGTAQNGLSA
jgi:uncharacterized OsmC-like protein